MKINWTSIDFIIIAVGAIFVFGILGYIAGRRKTQWLENVGESAVRRFLLGAFPGTDFHLMNNITLQFEDGTTQIDHILVSRYGIFVIETKHYKGWIFGDANSRNWTEVIYGYRSKFMNPIHQNFKHIVAVQKLLDFVPKDYIHSIVVFTGEGEFRTKRPEGVVDLYSLADYISQYNELILTQNRMQFCVGRIETARKSISKKTDVEHEEYLLRKHYNKLHIND